jgi:hypothetical protein
MLWAKIGLGLLLAYAIVACSVIDGLRGSSDAICNADFEVCEFCEARAQQAACGNSDPGPCGDAWSCVHGPSPGCGLEFSVMLDHFESTPGDCFNAGIPAVAAFLACKADAGRENCFSN